MRIHTYTLLRKGEGHPIFCEDYVLIQGLEEQWWVGAVMDGCSSGQDSHFASALMGKLLRRALRRARLDLERFQTPDDLHYYLLEMLFKDLRQTQHVLNLDTLELLSTLGLLIYHIPAQKALLHFVGDGVMAVDGEIIEIDQQNQPDYMAYHLDLDFEDWYQETGTQLYRFKAPRDLSIATDGVMTFRSAQAETTDAIHPATYLLTDLAMAIWKTC
ncbi:MAG: hypothetical protein HC913_00515 [Microscillaceae bacterium]|nr:hypothetical protein [Microscillaceae bacterium]